VAGAKELGSRVRILKGARLQGAHLERAGLMEAHLEGANLLEAVGLTDNALREAFGDARTKLPAGITRPKAWPPLEIEVG
jgi:uncharacterized protein YjbI with pentapeptide repeats